MKKFIGIMCILTIISFSNGCKSTGDNSETEISLSDNNELIKSGTKLFATALWKAEIPDSLTEDAEKTSDFDTYSEYLFKDSEKQSSISIKITDEEAIAFRKGLIADGLSIEDYACNKLKTTAIGGMNFVSVSYNNGIKYISRNSDSKMSIYIQIKGDIPQINDFFDSMEFTLPQSNETDPPYPWEGERFITETGEVSVGDYKLTAKQLCMNESFLPNDIFENKVVYDGKNIYVLSQKILNIYELNNDDLILKSSEELDDEYDNINITQNNEVILSSTGCKLLRYKDGKILKKYDFTSNAAMNRNSKWGIAYLANSDELKKITLTDDEIITEDFNLSLNPLKTVSNITITENYILICGLSESDNRHKVFIYDYDGNYKNFLDCDEDDKLGSITGICKTKDYFIAIDGNMRHIVMWDNDGKYLGSADDTDIFGTHYPWISGLDKIDENTFLVSLVEERADKSWDELVVYRLKAE